MIGKGVVAAIGTFDGVHKGHKCVLDTIKSIATEKGLLPVAVTFDRHPLSVIAPERNPHLITSIDRRNKLIERAGVKPILFKFDKHLQHTTALEWMKRLHDELGVEVLVVGYDNTFGSDGINLSLSDYHKLGVQTGIEVIEAPYEEGVSSSVIRKAIKSGDVEKAAVMLGRPFRLKGITVDGNKLGRTIGFPTANISIIDKDELIIPATGVYAAEAILPDGEKYPAMVNIGTRPTIRRGNQLTIEAHIIGWEGDLYDKPVILDLIKRLREEKKFAGIDDLRKQLDKDRQEVLKIAREGYNNSFALNKNIG